MSKNQVTCFASSIHVTSGTNLFPGVEKATCSTTATPTFFTVPRASALPPPGIPSGDDPLEGAPLRSYVPRPLETYDNRSFTDPIPQTWDGEITTVGTTDLEPVTKESLEKARQIQVDAAATTAFLEYSDSVREERKQALEQQAIINSTPVAGRPTCGEEEGRGAISNFNTIYLDGVKCVEYWGAPNGPVPRLFGDS